MEKVTNLTSSKISDFFSMKGLMKGIRRLRVGENVCKLISDKLISLVSTVCKELSELNNIKTIY